VSRRSPERPTPAGLWQRGQRGWPASFPLVQLPNPPLLAATGGWLVAASTDGPVHDYARAAFYAGLTVWTWEELTDGANWVRRALGAGGLVYAVARIGMALGASMRIAGAKRVNRRDSNPRPPGPQPAPTGTSEAHTALSGDPSRSQLP